MSFISATESVVPNKNYKLYDNFFARQEGGTQGSIFVIWDRNKPVPPNTVINFDRIPFRTATIYFCEKSSSKYKTIFRHNNVEYQTWQSYRFTKGHYAGRIYELVKKVAYVNQHLLPGERPLCEGVRFTHDGNAVKERYLMDLDLSRIERDYRATRARVEPCAYYFKQIVGAVSIAAATIFYILGMKYQERGKFF